MTATEGGTNEKKEATAVRPESRSKCRPMIRGRDYQKNKIMIIENAEREKEGGRQQG